MLDYWDEYKRFAPLAAIAVVFLVVVGVLVTGGDDSSVKKPETAEKKEAPAPVRKKPAPTSATGATAQVTPQSTKKVDPHEDRVPILQYHVIKTAPEGTANPEIWVSPADFKGQMKWLADNGYTGITMAQLFKYWDEGYELPEKPVVITFDEGYPSHARTARSVLASHKWAGVLFLDPANVGSPDTGLTSASVKKLLASGWELGAQGDDVVAAKDQVAEDFDVPVEFFAYPGGDFDAATAAAVEDAGFTGAVTELSGLASPGKPFELARIGVKSSDGVDGFAEKLRLAEQ